MSNIQTIDRRLTCEERFPEPGDVIAFSQHSDYPGRYAVFGKARQEGYFNIVGVTTGVSLLAHEAALKASGYYLGRADGGAITVPMGIAHCEPEVKP